MRKLVYIIFLFCSIACGQNPVYEGSNASGVAVGAGGSTASEGAVVKPPGSPPLATLELLTLKSTPVAEGSGALTRGAFTSGQGTPALGFVNTLTQNTAVTTRSTESWGTAKEGSFNTLANEDNIVIIMDVSGNITAGDGFCFDDWRTYIDGEYVSIYQNIGPEVKFVGTNVEIGVPPVSRSSCGGFYGTGTKHMVWIGAKIYGDDPNISSPGSGYTPLKIWSSNNIYFSHFVVAHGGDQQFDIRAKQRTAQDNGTYDGPYYGFGDITTEYGITANGFGSGSLVGPGDDNNLNAMVGSITYSKILGVNISHRLPNPVSDANASEDGYGIAGGEDIFIYNNHWHGPYIGGTTAAKRIAVPDNGWGYMGWTNNSFDWRNALNSATYIEESLFKGLHAIEEWNFYNIYAENNTVIGEVDPTTQDDWWRHRTANTIGGTSVSAQDLFPASEFGAEKAIPNAYYDIDISGADSLAVRDYLTTYAGPQWGTDSSGDPVTNVDAYMADIIDDVTIGTNNSAPSGLVADTGSTTSEKLPASIRTSTYADGTDNNGIPEAFETTHGLSDDPFDVQATIWDFASDPRHADYTVKNTAGYTNIEMYVFYINDWFWQLIDRGTIATDNSYIVTP